MGSMNIKEIKSSLSPTNFIFLYDILKEENPDSILASLSMDLLIKYFEFLTKSKNIFLFLCEYKNENVGYVILSSKPIFLISEFRSLKFLILKELILGLKFKTLANILLSIFKIDLFFLTKTKQDIINNNLNLSLLAIKKGFQSRGIGKEFVLQIIDDLKKEKNFDTITVETPNIDANMFYVKKLDFFYIGKKIRLFKNLDIFQKNL
jgi:ribosomal protein S18 acetylase RimI-like enzyme